MINNIQVLRAIAALNIVFYHAFGIGASYGYATDVLEPVMKWAANGVDIFFVISGFVMFYVQHSHPRSPWEFLKNRVKRIVPLYWSITLACVLLVLLVPSAFRQSEFDLQHAVLSLLFVSRFAGFEYPVLVPGWTLELEMLFYVLLAVVIAINPRHVILSVTALLAAGIVFAGIPPLVLEFPLGMLAGWCYVNRVGAANGKLLFIVGSALLVASILLQADPDVWRLLFWGVPSFLMVLGACFIPQVKKGLWVTLGSASYGIYLIHTLTLPVFYKFVRWIGISGSGAVDEVNLVLCVLFSALMGVCTYRFYERPLAKLF
ncbi:acyltransferase family protein [Herbaspirillum sp. alder98]|uniref:acyltransferase family protein n=1 Tax=Herbaspirillum sp. alder98 TaxID=2913096 RepID=UPI001CD8E236|nr:acyltransferase [Herbaspirillum sp. alder98]MCA1322640.1 acyltransferase [Herbaspirillum sp. alder98]